MLRWYSLISFLSTMISNLQVKLSISKRWEVCSPTMLPSSWERSCSMAIWESNLRTFLCRSELNTFCSSRCCKIEIASEGWVDVVKVVCYCTHCDWDFLVSSKHLATWAPGQDTAFVLNDFQKKNLGILWRKFSGHIMTLSTLSSMTSLS